MISEKSTICAISTPPGTGGIAVIRISGSEAIPITDKLFHSNVQGKGLKNQGANTLHTGIISEESTPVDEVVVAIFREPHSYTGEDVIEISCHGSSYIQQRILELLITSGARLAKRGEFTQRAFLNGKMDLTQAEAVADLIASGNTIAHKVALNQMRGGFSQEINNLRDELIRFMALIELELDFSEEDVEFANRNDLIELSDKIENLLKKLTDSFRLGNAIKNGIPVAIVGDTNVGKSTLLNALLNEEKAIVTDIHGTTRDIIEDTVNIDGVLFRLSDTAGLRETSDLIETLGIERSYGKIEKADIVLLVLDLTDTSDTMFQRITNIRERLNGQKLIIVGNKVDISTKSSVNKLTDFNLGENEERVLISAKNRINLNELIDKMKKFISDPLLKTEDSIVTNIRHYEALASSQKAIERVVKGLKSGISGDFLAQDIRECIHFLNEITGAITTEEVLNHIFKNFCIGK